ncbi:hypothetical protein [Vulcanisaeta souniana]|nr:hypothetical protein [Vulcanisaeta souniana]
MRSSRVSYKKGLLILSSMSQKPEELKNIIEETTKLVKEGYSLTSIIKEVTDAINKEVGLSRIIFNEIKESMVKISPGNVPVGLFTQCALIPSYYLTGKNPSIDWGDVTMHLLGKMIHNLAVAEIKDRLGNKCIEGVEVMYTHNSWTMRGKPDLDCGNYYLEFKTIMGRVTKARLFHDLIQAGFYSAAGNKNTYVLYIVLSDGVLRNIVPIEVIPEVGYPVIYAFKLWVKAVEGGDIGALVAKTTSCKVCRFRDICIMRTKNPHEVLLPGKELLDNYLDYVKHEVSKAGVKVIG